MLAFKGLLKKEFLITRLWFITSTIILLIAMASSFVIANYSHEPMVTVGFLITFTVFHFSYLPLMVLPSLRLEGKTQLWLYNPQSSKLLFLSKLTVSFVYQVISQFILVIFAFIIYKYVEMNGTKVEHLPIAEFTFIHVFILITAIYFSCWILFYWSVYHSLGKYPGIKKLRWLIIVLLIAFFSSIEPLLMKIKPLEKVYYDWKQPMLLNPNFNYENTSHTWNMQFNTEQLSIVPLIVYAIIAVTLYIISCWLLDRKVEV